MISACQTCEDLPSVPFGSSGAMKSSFKEEFERAVRTPAAPRSYSGSPAKLELRWERNFTNTIDAIKALRECGLSLADAKQQIEELMERRVLIVDLPFVPDVNALIARIEDDGAMARLLERAAE